MVVLWNMFLYCRIHTRTMIMKYIRADVIEKPIHTNSYDTDTASQKVTSAVMYLDYQYRFTRT